MKPRIKPFPYDAVETQDTLLVIFPGQGGNPAPSTMTVTPVGMQIMRPDGMMIRISNLHPRFRSMLASKPIFAIEISESEAEIYPVGQLEIPPVSIDQIFPENFFWYFGPETSSAQEVGRRPLPLIFSEFLNRTVSIAPGQTSSGPCFGLCQSRKILALPRGRRWVQATPGVIVDAGLAAGTTTGFAANDNIPKSVSDAHSEDFYPQFRTRRAWSSQLGCAFPPASTDDNHD